ncbi:MAG TPA: EcsC family protein [Dermatophilaceae bacterium]|nr:EcsC family protein [Dermatophilaceae bacterium]
MGIFGFDDQPAKDGAVARRRSALEQAGEQQQEGGLAGMATDLVERLLDAGIDGRGPFDSAADVARKARDGSSSDEAAIDAIVRKHLATAAAGGFVTGLGGFITMPIALPVNVVEFYLVATRMVAAIAQLRGYDLAQPQIRTAVLLTLVGADADDLLKKAGVVGGLGAGGRITNLAVQRLPGPALMVINKAIGFRLVSRAGRGVLSRLGKGVPFAGGIIGAGLDGYLIKRIGDNAKAEFPRRG